MVDLAVLADDLTGGMIVASLFEACGVVCPLVTSVQALAELPPDVSAVVLARKIRLVPQEIARAEARAAAEGFKRLGARRIFYKYSALFDSTAQGNIGPIAEALLAAAGGVRTVFCPAYIDRAVTLYKGRLFAGATPISETPKRFDPATPALSSDIVARLREQTNVRVGLLDHQTLRTGAADALTSGIAFWVADAVDDDDVARLAALVRDWPLVTGADSLPPALLRELRGERPAEPGSARRLLAASSGGEAVLAGSCGPATIEQLEVFEARHPVWRADLVRDVDIEATADAIADWAAKRLEEGPVAVATTTDREGVSAAQAAFGRAGSAERADGLLGAVAGRLRALGVTRFVVAGGETSGAVIGALGVERLEVAAYDLALFGGYCRAPGADGVSLVVKPGSMGGPDFFCEALDRMREAEAELRETAP